MPESQTRISVHVRPGAARNEVVRFTDGVWHVKIAAPPREGKANRELIIFLSQRLGVAKSALSIDRGQTSRHKVILVERLSLEEITRRLSPPSFFDTASK